MEIIDSNDHPVCFLSAEFAIDSDLPTYAGGLGILAADILQEAADEEFPMIGIGILYKGKNYIQHISQTGKMETRDSQFDHDSSFLRPSMIDGKPIVMTLDLGSTQVLIKAYKIRLSQKSILYFLSTDVDGNPPEWMSDMDSLYGGEANSQIRQQILLGVGGITLLKTLGIVPSIYHINEGRPGFIIWQLTANYMKENLPFEEAWQKAKSQIVYTNHTLVAAGNLTYPISVIENWATPFAKAMGVDTNLLIHDGFIDPQTFSITKFALEISRKHSSVSKVHGEYCKKEWSNYDWEVITNGVHMRRWQDSDFRNESLNDRQLWDLHMTKKRELVSTVIKRTGFGYDPERLVITWARRLADYKQPEIIFSDIQRLKTIIQTADKPVQLLFAGNSHSSDTGASGIIERIVKLFSTELAGNAIFVPNYNISLANHLVSGSDIWLNTPKGNLEACGTSGMKAIANGVLQCTVLDGWTFEVDWEDKGWILDPNNLTASLYETLEKHIVPLYYERNENGLPDEWIKRMRKSIETAKKFSAERMLEDYRNKMYI
jgi:glycogen phosphorylase